MYGLYQKPIIPLRRESKFYNMLQPFIFFPQLEPGESLVEFSHYYVPNIMNSRYYVSNYGRVWDAYRQIWMSYHFNHSYNPDGTNDGYCTFKVAYYASCTDIKPKDVYLHRAVLMTYNYIPGCEQLEVNHKDGDHTNNDLTNLEWATRKENMEHASRTGLLHYCEDAPNASLTNEQVHEICRRLENGESNVDIGRSMNVNPSTISGIKSGGIYSQISSQYNIPPCKPVSKPMSNEQVHEICRRLENGERVIDIANSMNIPRTNVNGIKCRGNYSQISSQYNIPEPINNVTPIETIHEICRQLENGLSNADIGRNLNINSGIVCNIRNGNTFKDISSQYDIPVYEYNPADKLSDETVHQICKLLAAGNSYYQVGKMLDIHYVIIYQIYKRMNYKYISKDYIW